MSGVAKTTSDSILGVIRKESWILDQFEIFVNIALNGKCDAWRRSALSLTILPQLLLLQVCMHSPI